MKITIKDSRVYFDNKLGVVEISILDPEVIDNIEEENKK